MSNPQVINKESRIVVGPNEINVDANKGFTGFWGTFKSAENESAAAFLVLFAQARGSWDPFPMVEMEEFYQSLGHQGFCTQFLVRDGFIVDIDDTYHFTYEFVGKAWGFSPVIESEETSEKGR